MRHLLDKAIVHILNEEYEQAERLIHDFMVQRGRQYHEKLRQGEDVSLTEGWDDEIKTESYFTEADLDAAEDEGGEADMGAADAASDLEADMGSDGDDMGGDDADMGDDFGAEDDMGDDMGADADAPMGDDMGSEEGGVESRVDDLEDQIAKLTAEFEQLMGEMGDGEGDMPAGDEPEGDMPFGDDEGSEEEPEGDDEGSENPFGGDDEGDEEEAPADDAEDEPADDEEEPKNESMNMDMDESYDDITESVLADLEKVVIDLSNKDGKQTDGSAVQGFNTTSPIPQKPVGSREGGDPIRQKVTRHTGFERETAPPSKDLPKRKNNRNSAKDFPESVPAPSNKEGTEGPAGGKTISVNTTANVARRTSSAAPRK
jgi:hypothetical protein